MKININEITVINCYNVLIIFQLNVTILIHVKMSCSSLLHQIEKLALSIS